MKQSWINDGDLQVASRNVLTKNFLLLFTEGLVSYIIPKGAPRGLETELSDKTYDGEDLGDRYVGGMGQLSDGQKGQDNFRSDIYGNGKGKRKYIESHKTLLPCEENAKICHHFSTPCVPHQMWCGLKKNI